MIALMKAMRGYLSYIVNKYCFRNVKDMSSFNFDTVKNIKTYVILLTYLI